MLLVQKCRYSALYGAASSSARTNEIDRRIRLVLTSTGPEYWSKDAVDSSQCLRRVKNLYYTMGFAELVYREYLMCDAKCKAAASLRLMRFFRKKWPGVGAYHQSSGEVLWYKGVDPGL